jgi:hypothetical protein
MKITTVRKIINKEGCETVVTIEDDLDNPVMAQVEDYLETVGFYEPRSIGEKFVRFISGRK